ncbi:MAG: EpsI family protein [Acidobacteria bacterium]|nr:EpsI family protein [Acidobacteriota bacterium]
MMSSSVRTGSLAALLALTYATVMWSGQRSPEELYQPLETIPIEVGDWVGREANRLSQEEEEVLRATSYLKRDYYREDGASADLFIAFYSMQQAGEAMHSPKNCLPGTGWEIWKYDEATIPFAGEPVEINRYYIQRGQSRLLVLYWYQSYERVVASEYYAKICLVWDSVMKHRTSGAIVRVTVEDSPNGEKEALDLAAKLLPLVKNVLPRPRG